MKVYLDHASTTPTVRKGSFENIKRKCVEEKYKEFVKAQRELLVGKKSTK